MKQKSSCLKRIGIGCGGIMALLILLGFMFFIGMKMNRPKPPDITTLKSGEGSGTDENLGLQLPDLENPSKPVKVIIDLTLGEFVIEPNARPGKFDIEGEYDRANFELTTKLEEKSDHFEYRVKFKNKKSLLGMMWPRNGKMGVDSNDINNHLRIQIPRDMVVDFDTKMTMGQLTMNLGGMEISGFSLDSSLGEATLAMSESNPADLANMKIKLSMGEIQIKDFQNFNAGKIEYEGSMGEFSVRNSGVLMRETNISARQSMGSVRIDIPENARFHGSVSAMVGESRMPREDPVEDISEVYDINVYGRVTMGEFNVNRRTSRESVVETLFSMTRNEGVEVAIAEYKRLAEVAPTRFDLSAEALNRLGYHMLRRKMWEDAIRIFQFNVEIHPDYINGYDSLGEGYMTAGEFELAIKSYEKALALDPDFDNAGNAQRHIDTMRERLELKNNPPPPPAPPQQ